MTVPESPRCRIAARIAIGLLALLVPLSAATHAPLAPAEARGRQIFLRGTSASGRDVTAVMAGSPVPAPMPCASCHGRDGRGRPEGGVRPANLEWATLSAASSSRPAYDDALLRRAMTMGIDAAGRRLDPAMPRYRLWRDDADDLVAWLRRLGTVRDPGVGDTTLRLRVAGAMLPLFRAWAEDVNGRGGIYARRIDIVGDGDGDGNGGGSGDRERTLEATGVAREDDVFAILGDPDAAQTRQAIDAEVPIFRSGTVAAERGSWVFELGPDAMEEVRRLLELAATAGAMPVAIPDGPFVSLCQPPRCRRVAAADAAAAATARSVLVVDPRDMPGPGRLALVPSAIAGEALAQARADAIVAARILPDDVDRAAAARYAIGGDSLVDQWSALAIARLTEQALVRAGRDLTREAFVDALTMTYEQATGFAPPVTFDRRRRHGIARIRLLRFTQATGEMREIR